jgi:thiol-disulfide isomerase/thioredoxin
MSQLRGKVVLVDFWTYSCINCLRSLPHVKSWWKTYKDQGLVIVGVSSPEFEFEKNPANVAKAIARLGVSYPVALDNNWKTWTAYNNECWPAEYLIDAQGRIRAIDVGEGNYDKMGAEIRSLLVEARLTVSAPTAPSMPDLTPTETQSPETYLGANRQTGFTPNTSASSLALNTWTLDKGWSISGEYIETEKVGATISYHFIGKNVYMVLSPPLGKSVNAQVYLDGAPISPSYSGDDVQNAALSISSDRLYSIVRLNHVDRGGHVLTIIINEAGLKAYTYTFG